MSPYFRSDKFYFYLVVLTAITLCYVNLGGYPIYILDEAKNAEAAREMWQSGNWFIPTFNNELRTDKPPLHYFFMMLSYQIFGVSAFSARFFSAFFGILTIVSTYYFTKKFSTHKLALLTVLVLCSSIFFVQEFHLAVPDPYLIFFVSFALFNFYAFHKNKTHFSLFIFYASIGFGALAKGPIAIALPGIIIALFLFTQKGFNWKNIFKYKPILGLLLTLLICVPWFVWIHFETNGAFTQGFFLEHNLNRFSGEMEGHGGLFFITWAFILLGLLPFSFFIIQAITKAWKTRKENEFIRFSLIISLVFIIFFSISSTKLPNYPMPSYPFIAILIAYFLFGVLEKNQSIKTYKISLWVLTSIAFLLPIGGFIALTYVETQLKIVNYVSLALIFLFIGCVLALIYLYKEKIKQSLLALSLLAMVLQVSLFAWVYPKLTEQNPVVLAKEKIDRNSTILLYKSYDPALLFNFESTFETTDDKAIANQFLNQNPNHYIITKKKYFDLDWKDEQTTVILQQKSLFENYSLIIFKRK